MPNLPRSSTAPQATTSGPAVPPLRSSMTTPLDSNAGNSSPPSDTPPTSLDLGEQQSEEALLSPNAADVDSLRNGNAADMPIWQRYFGMAAHTLCIVCLVVVCVLIRDLGGVTFRRSGDPKRIFNWHPFLMVLSFCLMTAATMAFRGVFSTETNRNRRKTLHGVLWSITLILGMFAVLAVFRSHNDPASGYIANMYSFHSWCALLWILAYLVHYALGLFCFAFNLSAITPSFRTSVMSTHRFLGRLLYVSMAVVMLLGLQEKEGFIGCGYTVNEPDVFPPQHYGEIPSVCRTSHYLGLTIIATTITTLFAIVQVVE